MNDTADIQLDRAEYEHFPEHPACGLCASALADTYYEINGSVACAACTDSLRAAAHRGTSLGRGLRAAGAGAAAALGGALLYYAILAITGYEFGLIAIVVGVAVGKAVSWGSGGRGGWRYQTLAVVLTYLAIVSAYVPLVFAEIAAQPEAAAVAAGDGGISAAPAADAGPSTAAALEEAPVSPRELVVALAMLAAFICALPFLGGLENAMGLVIIAFGLYQAWQSNRRMPLEITGPHTIAVPVEA